MYKFTVKMADLVILIKNIYSYTRQMCENYISDGGADIGITTNDYDINYEKQKSDEEADLRMLPAVDYSVGYLESLAVYRKLACAVLYHDAALFHGALISVDGEGYLFMAPSGTGKTTHIRLWKQKFGDRAVIVNGDKPLLRFKDDVLYGYGTPWCGKEGYNANMKVPIRAICVLGRGASNTIEVVDKGDAFAAVMPFIYKPDEDERMELTLDMVDRIVNHVKVTKLRCNMDPEAASVAYEGMK